MGGWLSSMAGDLSRWVLYLALAATVGAVVTGALLRRASATGRLDPDACSSVERARVQSWRNGILLLALAGAFRAWLQVDTFRDPGDPFWPMARTVLGNTTWGRGAVLQVIGVVLSLVAVVRVKNAVLSERLGVFGALALMAAPAWQGHAAGVDSRVMLAMGADAAHTAAFSIWIGTLLVLRFALLVPARASEPPGARAVVTRELVARFSPVALTCGGLLAATGFWAVLLHLTSVPDLWRTRWGQLLVAKLIAVAGVAAAGAYNWRRVSPLLGTSAGQAFLRNGVNAELLLAVLVLAITAILTGTGTPASD
ncbi:MAG: hypothetical protein MNPFHGCM_01734 [Gemmatimonadaceae bacterium]|nr:hypothetical protein [Gemmatimonadaceae bacterium]